jgi:hypothetical protein
MERASGSRTSRNQQQVGSPVVGCMCRGVSVHAGPCAGESGGNKDDVICITDLY